MDNVSGLCSSEWAAQDRTESGGSSDFSLFSHSLTEEQRWVKWTSCQRIQQTTQKKQHNKQVKRRGKNGVTILSYTQTFNLKLAHTGYKCEKGLSCSSCTSSDILSSSRSFSCCCNSLLSLAKTVFVSLFLLMEA